MHLKNLIIGIAISILTISVIVYGIGTFYPKPETSEFCYETLYSVPDENKKVCPSVCVNMYEIKNNECVFKECGSGCGPDGINTFEEIQQCEIALTGKNCWTLYDEEMERYSKKIFIIALPLGILILAIGAIIFGLETVGAGLMAGGVGVILWGVGGFWRFADNWIKFILSLIGLAILIYVAYYFNKKFEKKNKKKK